LYTTTVLNVYGYEALFLSIREQCRLRVWIVVFWAVTPCNLVGGYQRFVGTYCFHLQSRSESSHELVASIFNVYTTICCVTCIPIVHTWRNNRHKISSMPYSGQISLWVSYTSASLDDHNRIKEPHTARKIQLFQWACTLAIGIDFMNSYFVFWMKYCFEGSRITDTFQTLYWINRAEIGQKRYKILQSISPGVRLQDMGMRCNTMYSQSSTSVLNGF
jgi:hypothetical protein